MGIEENLECQATQRRIEKDGVAAEAVRNLLSAKSILGLLDKEQI